MTQNVESDNSLVVGNPGKVKRAVRRRCGGNMENAGMIIEEAREEKRALS